MTASSTTPHHHAHHHQHRRHWTFAHVQQRLRRNCFVGPMAFCCIVVLAMPMLRSGGEDIGVMVLQRLPLVEAVPFFRRAKAAALVRRRRASSSSSSMSSSSTASTATTTTIPTCLDDDDSTSTTALGLASATSEVEGETALESVESSSSSEPAPSVVNILAETTEAASIPSVSSSSGAPSHNNNNNNKPFNTKKRRYAPVTTFGLASASLVELDDEETEQETIATVVERVAASMERVTASVVETLTASVAATSEASPAPTAASSITTDDSTTTVTAAPTSATISEAAVTAAPTATASAKPNKKRKRDALEEFSFPLFAGAEAFEQDPDSAPIPFRYYEAHQQSNEAARKAVLHSLNWRKERQIDTILSRPNPNYDITKRALPHYFIGRSPVTGHIVFVQRPGLANLPLGYHNGIGIQDTLDQYAYVFEYCWNILHDNTVEDPNDDKNLMIGIMDLQGVNLGIIRKPDQVSFVKEFVAMIDAHYPTRAYKTYMVNAPGWFSTLYKLISPIMRETTKEKIVLFSAGKEQNAALVKALGQEMGTLVQEALRIPTKQERKENPASHSNFNLTSDILLETEMEQEIRQFVLQRLEQEGVEMNKVEPLPSKQIK